MSRRHPLPAGLLAQFEATPSPTARGNVPTLRDAAATDEEPQPSGVQIR